MLEKFFGAFWYTVLLCFICLMLIKSCSSFISYLLFTFFLSLLVFYEVFSSNFFIKLRLWIKLYLIDASVGLASLKLLLSACTMGNFKEKNSLNKYSVIKNIKKANISICSCADVSSGEIFINNFSSQMEPFVIIIFFVP